MAEREQAEMRVAERRSAIASTTRPGDGPPGPGALVRSTVLLVLAICILGVGPLLVVNGFFGALHVHVPPLPGLSLFAPTATEVRDLALPREAWTASHVDVLAQPGSSSRLATLEPGFPVMITAHRRAGTAMWSHITWGGPTRTSGGDGWAPDGAFISYGGQGRPIGDIGALSPQLLAATTSYGSRFGAALYFSGSGQLYRTHGDQAFALGDGVRPVLLATIYALNEDAGQHIGSAVAATTAARVASGDASAASFAYGAVGDKAGVSAYLTKLGIVGIQPAQGDWRGAQATPNALLQFYAALAAKQALNDTDRATVSSLLGRATSPISAQMTAILAPGNGGFLVIGVSQGASGWTMSVGGIFVSAFGSRVVLAAVMREQPTQAAAEAGLVTFYQHLAPLLADV